MLTFLIGIAIATVIVLGIVGGNIFICTFATLGLLVPAYGIAMLSYDHATWSIVALILTALVWGPLWIRINRHRTTLGSVGHEWQTAQPPAPRPAMKARVWVPLYILGMCLASVVVGLVTGL